MSRRTHLVGAWPGRSEAHAMERAFTEVGPYLDRMSDGETGLRALWVTPTVELFRAHPDAERIRDGQFTSYRDTPKHRIRDGHKLSGDSIDLGYFTAFSRSYPQFQVLRERFGRPDLRFQVGIPHVQDLAVNCFDQAGFSDPSIMAAFADATVREIENIQAVAGSDVVFQVETIVPLLMIAGAPAEQRENVADRVAGQLVDLVARTPVGTRFGAHLCLGDFNHESIAHLPDVSPWVLFANAIAAAWPGTRVLEYVHAPFAAAVEPPPTDESFYAPVADLRLPQDTRFIAGFIHESVELDDLRPILERIEGLVGGEVDVAASCGLGRRPDPEQAWDAMAKARALIEG